MDKKGGKSVEKSMYSLILMDEVVRKIDELAHSKGTSRSNLVNQILAERVALVTPQKRAEEIFDALARTLRGGGGLQARRTSSAMMQVTSALNYPYNPTIRYSVEIGLEGGRYTCEFKVASRTQSNALRSRLTVFYEVWSQIESGLMQGLRFSMAGGGFRRWLAIERAGALPDSQALGEAIGSYIRLFDKALKLSVAGEHGMDMQAYEQIARLCKQRLEESEIVV